MSVLGSDVFLDKWVHAYLAGLLRIYSRSVMLDRAKLDVPVPGLASFYDLWVIFVFMRSLASFRGQLLWQTLT